MGSESDRIFAAVDADAVRAAVVRALRASVSAAGDSFHFGQPRTDGYTYGNDLWRFACFELAEQLGVLPGASVRRPRGSFLVDLGVAVLYPFRFGASESSELRAFRLADSQFRRELLVDPVTAPSLFWPEVVLVPYAANPTAGLLRAFMGGARIIEGDLLDWMWLEELEVGGAAPPGAPSFAQEPVQELELGLTGFDRAGPVR